MFFGKIILVWFLTVKARVFYNVKNGSSFIRSKSSSENLSNDNKYLYFCCLQDKTWIKMPKWTIFLVSSKMFVLITDIFWQSFWRNKWRSVFDVVKDSSLWCAYVISACQKIVLVVGKFHGWVTFQVCSCS